MTFVKGLGCPRTIGNQERPKRIGGHIFTKVICLFIWETGNLETLIFHPINRLAKAHSLSKNLTGIHDSSDNRHIFSMISSWY